MTTLWSLRVCSYFLLTDQRSVSWWAENWWNRVPLRKIPLAWPLPCSTPATFRWKAENDIRENLLLMSTERTSEAEIKRRMVDKTSMSRSEDIKAGFKTLQGKYPLSLRIRAWHERQAFDEDWNHWENESITKDWRWQLPVPKACMIFCPW